MRLLLIAFLFLLFSSCGESYTHVGTEVKVPEKGKMKEDSLLFDSIGRFYFSRVRSPGAFGLFHTYYLPGKNQNKELWVVVEGRVRSNVPHSMGTITLVASNEKDEMLCWKACFLRSHITELNTWCRFKDSIFLPEKLESKAYNKFNVFGLLGNSPGEAYDMDSLVVTVKQKVSLI
ncbi:MAG: hypothetical protein K0S12_1856 [Bacteroidetes bacterium]|jgi:hypothetical protein|nr:hypothetical protein [Bacteroidota bacterium]